MKSTVVTVTFISVLLCSMGAMVIHLGFCMPLSSDLHVYDDTTVYDIGGRGVNVTITVDKPENKAYNSTLTFTLQVLEPYTAHGYTVNPDEYVMEHPSFPDCYLVSGVILDYDKARVINASWVNWGKRINYGEEALLFRRSYEVVYSKSGETYYGSAILPELTEGSHNFTVWVRAQLNQITTYIPCWAAFSKTATFTIDTVAPKVTVLSSESNLYKTSSMPLNFTVNEPYSSVMYCLDGQDNVTISGNTTLTGLANGDHNVTVYATDEFGNTGVSESTYFSVEVPFPTTLVATVSVAIAAVASISLLVYFKKRKR